MISGALAMTTRRGVPLTNKERRQHDAEQALVRSDDRKAIAEKAKAEGARKVTILQDGKRRDVWARPHSYRAMGFQDHQIHAAERFEGDWSAAYSTIRGQGFEPAVDGSGAPHRIHFARVDAQTTLRAIAGAIGKRSWEVVVAVVINGATITGMAKAAKLDVRAIRQIVNDAFDDLDGVYAAGRKKDRTWEAVERYNLQCAEMIERAEREVG